MSEAAGKLSGVEQAAVLLLTLGEEEAAAVLRHLPANPGSAFFDALPRGLHLVAKRRFPGLAGGAPVLVYRWGAG